ncbi:hypothetical protein MATR_08440 [Marivirga tractuosa]|uniref:DUF3347 domain-containing protein n=1 Tax=Marivirga tractuosa (strain ATCC 23168 / DSM 4126 / NBRC 15989 / NCIMB 1408 / VKM B-1430 / H-43) TaxID=643867 RepID=E4TPD9_MARTH|nr:DUF3347 domain-containing protein [Marivirga tractuosa]ADR21527.1 hypothetical protein Ftrac_1537 [Marivirga tractuosa DSM 4126]BDD14019.1 hypothetical protein MATR_08440 [Marivirga tractuosa]
MKRVIISLVTLAVLTFGCSQEKKSENQTAQEAPKEEQVMQASTSEVSSEQLKSILSSYFNVKDALVDTDAAEAKSALAKLLESIGSEFEQMKSLAKQMHDKEDVEDIRSDFDDLSEQVYVLVKENSESKDQTVYKQYCPMAFNNEGAFWLSDKEEIRNPYFGDKMLKCGKVQEEL